MNLFPRIASFLLAAGLMADPSLAAALSTQSLTRSIVPAHTPGENRFQEEALAEREVSSIHHRQWGELAPGLFSQRWQRYMQAGNGSPGSTSDAKPAEPAPAPELWQALQNASREVLIAELGLSGESVDRIQAALAEKPFLDLAAFLDSIEGSLSAELRPRLDLYGHDLIDALPWLHPHSSVPTVPTRPPLATRRSALFAHVAIKTPPPAAAAGPVVPVLPPPARAPSRKAGTTPFIPLLKSGIRSFSSLFRWPMSFPKILAPKTT